MVVTDEKTNDLQLVVFSLGNEEFGADIAQVKEIIKVAEITPIPQAPPDIHGVINLRGKITTVVNLRKRLGMEDRPADGNSRIVIAEVDGIQMGIMVDSVTEVKYVNSQQVEPISRALVDDVERSCMLGICKLKEHLLILIDLRRALSDLSEAAAGLAA